MNKKYSDYEKSILTSMFHNIKWEYDKYNQLGKDKIIQKMMYQVDSALKQILAHRDINYCSLLNNLIPPKRGAEECDCNKVGKCGCKVEDFNAMIEEVAFAVELAKSAIKGG